MEVRKLFLGQPIEEESIEGEKPEEEQGGSQSEPLSNGSKDQINAFFDNLDYQEIGIDEVPTADSWALNPLFKEDTIGNMRIWQIGFNFETEELFYRHGVVKTGNFTVGSIKIETNKSGRTLQEQALLQARRKYMDKFIEDLYRPAGMEESVKTVKAALANDYKPGRVKIWPVAVNCKLDGERMRAMLDPNDPKKIQFKSRSNRSINLPHFEEELKIFMRYLPGCMLDGELYKHGYKSNQIRSIVSTHVGGQHPLLPTIKYFMFDIYYEENPQYEIRYNRLLHAYQMFIDDGYENTIFEILACSLAYNETDLKKYHDYYVSKGYEGMVIRKLAGPNPTSQSIRESSYRDTRTNNILKYKEFDEEEGTVVDVYEGKGKEEGLANFKVQDPRGNILGVHPSEEVEQRRKWFKQGKSKFLGRIYTYRYFGLSEYGVPRFPIGVGFRDLME